MMIDKFITPITNRSQSDVLFARNYIQECIRKNRPMVEHLRGCLNYSDLNRIESNTLCLAYMYDKWNIKISLSSREKPWTQEDILTSLEIQRIIDNVRKVVIPIMSKGKRQYLELPVTLTHFEHINRLEMMLEKVYLILINTKVGSKLADTFKAGQKDVLPLKLEDEQKEEDEEVIYD